MIKPSDVPRVPIITDNTLSSSRSLTDPAVSESPWEFKAVIHSTAWLLYQKTNKKHPTISAKNPQWKWNVREFLALSSCAVLSLTSISLTATVSLFSLIFLFAVDMRFFQLLSISVIITIPLAVRRVAYFFNCCFVMFQQWWGVLINMIYTSQCSFSVFMDVTPAINIYGVTPTHQPE